MITIYFKANKKVQLKKLATAPKNSLVYCFDPDEEEVEALASKYRLDKSLISDALDPFEVPRLETLDKDIYAISSFPQKEGDRFVGIPFAMIVSRGKAFIVSRKAISFVEEWLEGNSITSTQVNRLVNSVFRRLMESYYAPLTDINRGVHKISMAPTKITSGDIARLVIFEEALNLFVGDLLPTDAILRKLPSSSGIKLLKGDKALIEDTALYTEQLIAIIKSNLKTISNIRDAYSAIVTANLNSNMKFLTAATVILTVPTIIASIFGMNVNLPLATNPLAFVIIILLIVIVSLLLIYLFVKQEWF